MHIIRMCDRDTPTRRWTEYNR